jgi:hypothetical protein
LNCVSRARILGEAAVEAAGTSGYGASASTCKRSECLLRSLDVGLRTESPEDNQCLFQWFACSLRLSPAALHQTVLVENPTHDVRIRQTAGRGQRLVEGAVCVAPPALVGDAHPENQQQLRYHFSIPWMRGSAEGITRCLFGAFRVA